nr:RHS repeat-associated core domain-containing protein [Pseudoalteromonas sp. T1lg22]
MPTTVGIQTMEYRVDNTLLDNTTIGNLNTSYQYNNYGEQTFESVDLNESNLFNVTYTRDDLGRIESKVVNTPSYSHKYGYTYTPFGHLETETVNGITTTYIYDDNGNRLTRSVGSDVEQGVVDEQDRLMSYGDCTYTYSLNGELATKTCAQIQTVYSYDVMGNLLEVEITDTSTQESNIIRYGVDAQDRRIAKYVDGVKAYGLLYSDQLSPIAMLDGDNNVTATFIYGTRVNVPDYMVKDGISYKFITDQLGSPLMVVDTATGNIAQQLTYDAFGRVLSDSNPGFQPFGFAGGLYDKETGLVRFGARDYDAYAGRWTNKDPIRFASGDLNIYGYANSDPVNLVDINGMEACSCSKVIGAPSRQHLQGHSYMKVIQPPMSAEQARIRVKADRNTAQNVTYVSLGLSAAAVATKNQTLAYASLATGGGAAALLGLTPDHKQGDYMNNELFIDWSTGGTHHHTWGVLEGDEFDSGWQNSCSEN